MQTDSVQFNLCGVCDDEVKGNGGGSSVGATLGNCEAVPPGNIQSRGNMKPGTWFMETPQNPSYCATGMLEYQF